MIVATTVVASIVTRSIASTSGLIAADEPFSSISNAPDILNHLSIDDSNVDRGDNDFYKTLNNAILKCSVV
jgi:hypothetical protein